MNLDSEGVRDDGAHPAAKLEEEAPAEDAAAQAPAVRRIQKRLVILATPQTGSSHCVDLLDSHPQITCLGELFTPKGTVMSELGMRNRKVIVEAGKSPLDFLERVTTKLEKHAKCKPVFGFKLMLHHDPRVMDHILEDPSWKVIVLERRDLLAQWMSMALAKKSARWESTGGGKGKGAEKESDDEEDDDSDYIDDTSDDESGPVRKVTFDAWKFEQFCFRQQARYVSLFHRLGQRPHFRLFTEEMDASHPKLLEFLGVEPMALPAAPTREHSASMRDRIENYDAYAKYAKRRATAST